MQPIDKYLPDLKSTEKRGFQHSDEWRRDFQQQINELRSLVDMTMFRIATLEGQQSALSHKVHMIRYPDDGQ